MAVGMMEINRSDSDEMRISKINSNFKALIGCLSKGMTGFTVAGQGYGYYNALRDRLEVDNAYIDNLSTYLMQAKYASIGTAWIQNVSFQNAVGEYLNVDTVAARLMTAEVIESSTVRSNFVDAVLVHADVNESQQVLTNWLTASTTQSYSGIFNAIFSETIQSSYINASYINAGVLKAQHIIVTDDKGREYLLDVEDNEQIFKQIDGSILEDSSVEQVKLSSILLGQHGQINLDDGTFIFYTVDETTGLPNANVLQWDGSKLLMSLEEISLIFNNGTSDTIVQSEALGNLATYNDDLTVLAKNSEKIKDVSDDVRKWMTFSDGSLEIGEITSESIAKLTLTANDITLSKGSSQARLDAKGLTSEQAIFNNIQIGSFVLESTSIGHLSLKYIGS